MCNVALKIPEEVVRDTRMNTAETAQFVKEATALAYYTQRGVSLGYCAQIADMTERDFISYLGKNKISVFRFDNEDEFKEELANA